MNWSGSSAGLFITKLSLFQHKFGPVRQILTRDDTIQVLLKLPTKQTLLHYIAKPFSATGKYYCFDPNGYQS